MTLLTPEPLSHSDCLSWVVSCDSVTYILNIWHPPASVSTAVLWWALPRLLSLTSIVVWPHPSLSAPLALPFHTIPHTEARDDFQENKSNLISLLKTLKWLPVTLRLKTKMSIVVWKAQHHFSPWAQARQAFFSFCISRALFLPTSGPLHVYVVPCV